MLCIDCHYAECRSYGIVLSVVMLSVVILTVAAPFFLSVAANCILHLLGVFFGQVLSEASAVKLLQS